MKEIIVDSLSNFIYEVENLYKVWDIDGSGDIWFRGINNENNSLIPGIMWRTLQLSNKERERKENTIIEEFRSSSIFFTNQKTLNAWECYSMMQHYGLPTRLLDWTKAPLIALFFALTPEENITDDRIIWAIDPFLLNKEYSGNETLFTPNSYSDDDENVDLYLPRTLFKSSENIPSHPIAIEPTFSNNRIFAQQGCFTLHGSDTNTIDEFYQKKNIDKIIKIRIKCNEVKKIYKELNNLGIREDIIYQDLNSLSRRIISDHLSM